MNKRKLLPYQTESNSWESAVRWLREESGLNQLVKDCYYDDPLLEAAERYQESEEWQAVRSLLKARSGKVLDVGAGRGIASYALAREGFDVTALEPDPSLLVGSEAIKKLAKDSTLDIKVSTGYLEKLPFEDDIFDVIFARAALHHTAVLKAACGEVSRVLKPGGVFIAIREHVISRQEDLAHFFDTHPLHHKYGGEQAFLLSDYKNAIKNAGFTKLEVISPWASPLNYAPRSLKEVQESIATRFGPLSGYLEPVFRVPGLWPVTRRLLALIDQRPGRLYSFIAFAPM